MLYTPAMVPAGAPTPVQGEVDRLTRTAIRMTRHGVIARHRGAAGSGTLRAFTLVELLVVVALIAVLIALLLPAVAGTMASGRAFKCQINERSVGFAFLIFADDTMEPDRGRDDTDLPGAFRLETFQESQYGIDEFWNWENPLRVIRSASDPGDPMRCPEVKDDLVLRRNAPCSGGGVGPAQAVSFGFNIRFHIAPSRSASAWAAPVQVALMSSSFSHPSQTPLFWDVDGEVARESGVSPVFSGPALGSPILMGDRYWFPGLRHGGAANFGFADGHVESSRRPLDEGSWLWDTWPRH